MAIAGDAARFPDQCPNAAFGPYQLRLTVTSKRGTVTTAWTFFDVLVDHVELHYGPMGLIPAGTITDVLAVYQAMTDRDEQQLVTDLQANGTAIPTADIPLPLKSTQAAYVHFNEWFCWRDLSFLRHKGRWGEGPRIPILAKVFLKDIDDAPKHNSPAAKALGPAKFLWDWQDKAEAVRGNDLAAAHADTQAFVMQGLKYKENAPDEPPASLNCHDDRGGKRGSALKIFPAQTGTAAFPFKVEIGQVRKWASFSTAQTGGTYACCTGVIFQPCRMALDSYKIRVAPALPRKADKITPTLEDARDIAALLVDHPGLPSAETGMFEVRRRIDAQYARKSAATPAMDLANIGDVFRVGGIDIVWTNIFWTAATYRSLFADSENPDNLNVDDTYIRGRRHSYPRKARVSEINKYRGKRAGLPFLAYDHWSGELSVAATATASEAQLTLPGREVVLARFVAPLMISYINKDRKYNDKKRKWNKIKLKYPALPVEGQYLRFYQEALTDTERTKENFEASIKAAYIAEDWGGWAVADDNPVQWAADNYFYGYGFGSFLQEVHQRAILADAFEGMTFYHYTHMYQTKKLDGTDEALQWDLGGLAAVGMSADLGFKAAFIVWDHPNNGQRQTLRHSQEAKRNSFKNMTAIAQAAHLQTMLYKDGDDTAAHEFGHFLHLPHSVPQAESTASGNVHDAADLKCIMNYDHDGLHLCGGCALRLRGWAHYMDKGKLGFSQTAADQPGNAPPAALEVGAGVGFNAIYADFV